MECLSEDSEIAWLCACRGLCDNYVNYGFTIIYWVDCLQSSHNIQTPKFVVVVHVIIIDINQKKKNKKKKTAR